MSESLRRLGELRAALDRLEGDVDRIDRWGDRIGRLLATGGRLLAVGNGGSAAQAAHLTAELVGRFDGERRPLAALAIGAEHATTTAIVNDYGIEEAFARPVRGHGRPGDVLVALSTSGRSTNVRAAVEAARECGLATLALTGPLPNPLADEVRRRHRRRRPAARRPSRRSTRSSSTCSASASTRACAAVDRVGALS